MEASNKKWKRYNIKKKNQYLVLAFETHSLTEFQLIGAAGRVESLTDSSISVRFNRPRLLLSFNPMVLKKLNELTMNQTIRIKDNETVIDDIRTRFGELMKEDTNFELVFIF